MRRPGESSAAYSLRRAKYQKWQAWAHAARRVHSQQRFVSNSEPSRRKVPQKKVMPKQPSVINKSAYRAAMSVYGKKPKVKKGKKVRVSRKFAQKVKKVNAGNVPYGDYTTVHCGYIGFVVPDTTAANTGVQFENYTAQDGSTQNGISWPGRDIGTYARCCFGILASTGTSPLATLQGTEMLYFTPMKILNAASCLWNRKAPGVRNYATTAGNLVTGFRTDLGFVGVPQESTGQNNSLKIEIVKSYVTWEMKNVSQRQVKVIIHELSPKQKFGDNMPLTEVSNLMNFEGDTPNQDQTYTFYNGAASSTISSGNYAFTEPAFNLMKIDGLQWKGLKREILIQPGETCKHSIQGPSRTTIDFSKFLDGALVTWGKIGIKGYSVACMVEVMLDPQYTAVANDVGYRPTFRQGAGTNKCLNDPIQITVTERFKLRCPNVVGFINPTLPVVVGTNQLLNLRKKKIRIDNWSAAQGQSAVTYSSFNEEIPSSAIGGSVTM